MRFLAARRRHGLLSLALAAALSLTALPGLAQADRGQVVADALASLSTDGLTCTTPALTRTIST